jgi:ATP-dependent protease ClpP protease subunit
MSLRNLPEIKALEAPAGVSYAPEQSALDRWQPGVRAASEGDDNVISIYDIIGEDFWTGEGVTSKRIAAALRRIGQRAVTVNVNSPGGDFFEGIGIYELLRQHPAKVTVQVMGLAASAASVIAMAGDEVLISEVGFMMVHNAWAIAIGNRHDMRAAADTLEPFDQAMANLYARRAGVDLEEAEGWMNRETWFNGGQAVDSGLADGLLPPAEIEESQADTRAVAAVRKTDLALARMGMSRGERRSLIGELKGGTPSAAAPATHDAGDLVPDLRDLIATIQ